MAPRPPRPRAPSLEQQLANLQRLHPTVHGRIEAGRLIAEGWIRGNVLTRRYRVRIEYTKSIWPRAFVLEPALERRHPAQPVAHTHAANEPCLYRTRHGDWLPTMYLGQTIVPWLMEWLVFYETWRATGDWQGGGTLPDGYDQLARRPDEHAA